MQVKITPLFDLAIDGRSLGNYTRDQLIAIRATISRLLLAEISGRRQDQILFIVSDFFGLDQGEIMAKRRTERVVWPRHCAMVLLRDHGLSASAIGRMFRQDHVTVSNAFQRVRERIDTNHQQAEELQALRALLSPESTIQP